MKKMICCILALLAICTAALGEMPYETVRLNFEDGFSLSLPASWVSYEVPGELSEQGFLYCLGSSDAAQLMYIQRWPSDCIDLDGLKTELVSRDEIVLGSSLASASGASFLMYNFAEADCSGCMTLLDGDVLNLLFLPQSDENAMLIAATVMDSYAALD